MGLYCVYKHTSPSGKVYIGITSQNPICRWQNGGGYIQNKYFYTAIQKYGWNSFKHEILYSELSKEDACEIEKQLIAEYRSNEHDYGYNHSTGGENPAQGVVLSDETKFKMSQSQRGRVVSEAGRRNMSIAAKKRGNGRTGKVGEECKKSIPIYQLDFNGNIISMFFGSYEAERKTGISKSHIGEACRGRRKSAGGYKWAFVGV